MKTSIPLLASLRAASFYKSGIRAPEFINNTFVSKNRVFTCTSQIACSNWTLENDLHIEEKLRSLQKHESSIFQWYFHTQGIPTLREDRTYKIYMRKKWHSLSDDLKTLYYFKYFNQCLKIDYHKLTTYKFARLLDWHVPPTSPYILFRKQYKQYHQESSNCKKINKHSRVLLNNLGTTDAPSFSFRDTKYTSKQYLSELKQKKQLHLQWVSIENSSASNKSKSDLYKTCRKCWHELLSTDQKLVLEKTLIKKFNLLSCVVEKYICKMDRLSWKAMT